MRRTGCLLALLLALIAPAWADDEARRMEVMGGFIEVGAAMDTEQPDLVLELIDGLRASPVPDDLDVELCLAGAEAARQAGLPSRMRAFTERARALAGQGTGSSQVTVQWLVESYEFEDLRRRDPEKARAELPARLDRVLGLLDGYRPDAAERARWSLLQAPPGRALAIWLDALVAQAAGLPGADARMKRLLALGGAMSRAWAQPGEGDPTSARLGIWIGFLEARLHAMRRVSPDDPLASVLDPTAEQAELEAQARKLVETITAATGIAPPEELVAVILGAGKARLALQEVRWLCMRAEGRKFTPAEGARVKELLLSAAALARDRASLALVNDLYVTGAEAFFHSSREGWQANVDRILGDVPPSIEKSRPDLVKVLTMRGRLRLLQGRSAEARADVTRAIGLLEALVQETGGTPAAAERIREEARDTYELLTRLQVEAGESKGAFETVSRYQQVESACLFGLDDLAPGSDLGARQERLRSLEGQPDRSVAFTEARQGVQDEYARLKTSNAALDRLALKPVDLPGLQSRLPEDAVLVQIFPGEDRLYLFTVTRQKLGVHEVKAPWIELEAAIGLARLSLSRPPASFAWDSPQGQELDGVLKGLYAKLLGPAEPELAGRKLVILAPSGGLLYVPWAALRRPDGRFLVQEHALVTVTRTVELDRLLGQAGSSSKALVALGNPDGSLPGAEAEVRDLEALFPGAQVFVQGKADRAAVVGSGKAGMLHLATHGVLNRRDPSESFLVLAAGERLRVGDIPGISLEGLGLVSLSACETALGERAPGAQLRSLAEAFSLAGGRAVLATLWKIDDASTRELIRRFYGGMAEGRAKAQALQAAQVALLGEAATAHPFHWAAFVLFGDFR